MGLYDGPIVDAHHHLWTYRPDVYPWLAGDTNRALARTFTPADYRAAAGDLDIVATVVVEAVATDPLAEATAAGSHEGAIGAAVVAHAQLDAPDIEHRLDRLQTAVPRLRGIRDIVAVRKGHASFARRPDLLNSAAFEIGLRILVGRGLTFDLMLEPWQMPSALALAARVPDLTFVIEHSGSPDFSSSDGIALWREAMRAAAGLSNMSVKISALHCRMPGWNDDLLAPPIQALVDWFGVDRLAFASDYPVHDLACPFRRAFETFARAVVSRSQSEQAALFHDTARRLYRI